MLSHVNTGSTYETTRKTLSILVAVALNMLELFIPRIPFLPWLKPGLANSITIIWIIRYGTVDALLFTIVRVWISSFYSGFSLVTIALALSGGILSTLCMGSIWKSCGPSKKSGTIGIAIAGAFFHNVGQLGAVYFMLTRNAVIFYQLPFMGAASLFFGGLTGCITPLMWNVFSEYHPADTLPINHIVTNGALTASRNSVAANCCITLCLALALWVFSVSSHAILGITAIGITVAAFFFLGRNPKTLIYPARLWFLFIVIGAADLFFSNGKRVLWLPLVTYEGVSTASAQSLRLWIWIQTSLLLHEFRFNTIIFSFLGKLFPRHGSTLAAGLFALEFFPEVLLFVKSDQCLRGLPWKKPLVALPGFVARVCGFVLERLNESTRGNLTRASTKILNDDCRHKL